MNCTYRSIWNDKSGTFVAVSENAKSAGKKTSSSTSALGSSEAFALKALAVCLMLSFGSTVYALPAGGVVAAGGASISSGAGSTTITQTTQNAAINWQSFNIAAGEAVRFVQPNSSSVVLNRVLGADPSSILGNLLANGKVFLVNPNGILFGTGAQVNVGGLVASTLNIADSDFMAGNYKFAGAGNGMVLNQGSINADGGYVALLGANVRNDGVILAKLGTVALAAGNAITLDLAGDGLLNVTVNQGAVNALVQNGGLIQADGGQVLLTAKSAGSLLQSAVNNTGVIQAQTIVNHNGTIRLMGDMQSGTVNVGGTLDASAPNGGNGGFIEASAARVFIASDAHITTAAPVGLNGTFLIDPQDFTVGSALGDNITGAALSTLLNTNNVIISTDIGTDAVVAGTPPVSSKFSPTSGNGDIFITEAINWTTGGTPTTLTLNAARDVNIGRDKSGTIITTAAITATGGNLVVCCGRDINVDAAITTAGAGGSTLLSAGNNINVNAAVKATNGNITFCAGNDVNLMGVNAAITLVGIAPSPGLSLGLANGLVLSSGTNGTGAGTVNFAAGTPPAAITDAPVTIYYNPVSYAAPTDYSGATFFTLVGGSAKVTQFMLVHPDGGSKAYDGTAGTTLSGLKGAPAGVTLVANPGSTATFDTSNVGTNKTVTFSGYSLGGIDASKYAFATTCCGPIVRKTIAAITPAIAVTPLPPVVPPGGVTPFAVPSELPYEGPIVNPRVIPLTWMPVVVSAVTPPELLTLAPAMTQPDVVAATVPQAQPVVVPAQTQTVVPAQAPPKLYVAPHRPRKQDRN